jgi:hypothetical protein
MTPGSLLNHDTSSVDMCVFLTGQNFIIYFSLCHHTNIIDLFLISLKSFFFTEDGGRIYFYYFLATTA